MPEERTQTDEIRDALNLATALATATNARFMALEHGAAIWKQFLKFCSFDVAKQSSNNKDAKKA